MDTLRIVGGARLSGTVAVSGSKNAALPILFATLLTDGDVTVHNVPDLRDIDVTLSILGCLGKQIIRRGDEIVVRTRHEPPVDADGYLVAPYDLIRRMRASFLLAGALLARHRKVRVALPGGCAIGVRPVDIHLDAFRALGCTDALDEGYVVLRRRVLRAGRIAFRFPSVGATENALLAAALAPGETVVSNAAQEPEVADLAAFLGKLGVAVHGAGTPVLRIRGVRRIRRAAVEHRVIPDRIEAGTYLLAAAVTRGAVFVRGAVAAHNAALLAKLRAAGVALEVRPDGIGAAWRRALRPQRVVTRPFPGFPTDLQAQFMTLMALTRGRSEICEHIFENRFVHVAELRRMGADITLSGRVATVYGVPALKGCPVMVSDLRAGAALVLAGLAASGTTVVNRLYHLDRGYEKLEHKLAALGADIRRVRN